MKTKDEIIANIKANPEIVYDLLVDIANSYETEGCEDCGTVGETEMKPIKKFLGWK